MSGDIRPNAMEDVLDSADQERQLLQSAFHGNLDLVKSLLTKDNLNARDAIGRTPLAVACWGGHYDVAEHLLKAGADIAGQFRHVAALKHAEIVELLLRYGADVNEQWYDGQRPLHYACERENIEVAKVLIKYGGDVSAEDNFGKTPLHYAASRGNHSLTLLLLEHHSDVNSTDANLKTPLHGACHYISVVRALLENGANVSPFDANGCTPLNMVQVFSRDVLTVLLDYGCGANVICRRPKCLCNRTVLMCHYFEVRKLHNEARSSYAQSSYELDLWIFERYFIKARVAELLSDKNAPPNDNNHDWTSIQSDAFRATCSAELAKMKSEFIEGSTVDYHSVLSQDLSKMRNQLFSGLTAEGCRRKFPVYGDMIYCQFLKAKRLLLLEQCSSLFSLTDLPWLPPECVSGVLEYLSDEDLSSAAALCGPIRT